MFVSIVLTALILHYLFKVLGIMPGSQQQLGEVTRFAIDYTFYLNLFFVLVAGAMVWLHIGYKRQNRSGMGHEMAGDGWLKQAAAMLCLAILAGGLVISLVQ
jgi:heme/copper-type cytochrome/quinol oxidase subunit 2